MRYATTAVSAALLVSVIGGRAYGQEPPPCLIGEVRMFAGNFAPRNWALAEGQVLPIVGNEAVFSLVGTYYGGDGRTTFALPDFRGRGPVGMGQGPGLTNRNPGDRGGEETVTQTVDTLAPHTHVVRAYSGLATHIRPQDRLPAKVNPTTAAEIYSPGPADVSMSPAMIASAGGGQPQNNMPPYLGISFIICVQGDFPQRQ